MTYQGTGPQVEIALPRRDVTEGVVPVGDTVRRPHQARSPAVAAYLGGWAPMWGEGIDRIIERRVAWFTEARAPLAARLDV